MSNETESPERIWVDDETRIGGGVHIHHKDPGYTDPYLHEYTRADLSDAKDKRIELLDGNRKAIEAEIDSLRETYEFRIAELEAELAKVKEASGLLAQSVDDFGNLKPSDSSAQWGSRLNRCLVELKSCRATIAELKGTG